MAVFEFIRGYFMYTEKQLAAVARRENNTKRAYLVVNKLQGKHIPVNPQDFFDMTASLATKVKAAYPDEKLLLIGFAETATAIGAALASYLDTPYIQTTRESIDDVTWLNFTESHSHATEQKLVRDDIEAITGSIDRIIFVEDEITTGNTIKKIIDIIIKEFGNECKFAVASLLNGMNEQSQKTYSECNIDVHYLVKTQHDTYTEIASRYLGNGNYHEKDISKPDISINELAFSGMQNARRLVSGTNYSKACDTLYEDIRSRISFEDENNILILGTEECMYPALYIASKLSIIDKNVKCHSTTRSPIAVSKEKEYPLHNRYELASLYDRERTTYIYDLDEYDCVIIITDSKSVSDDGINSLANALIKCGNKNINLIKWEE